MNHLFEKNNNSNGQNHVDILCPAEAVIKDIITENSTIKTFVVEILDEELAGTFTYLPGQFVMVSVPHKGEAPISISSHLTTPGLMHLSIRKAGRLTSALHQMKEGDHVGIRGPYGRPFPMQELQGRDILLVAGGIGLAPLRSVIEFCLHSPEQFGSITLLYGSRAPSDIAFRADLDRWAAEGVDVRLTVDVAEPGWKGHVGLVTKLLEDVQIGGNSHSALLCGPPIMIDVVTKMLQDKGLSPDQIITTLERNMKCGVGLCGHCYMNGVYICKHGPVFTVSQLNDMRIF
ncbi:MAG: oxidoreductase [Thermodesulfobacteria bacterium]|nr:oxidoreductase [Thermodesulfobacteriota bacterium]